jgi:PKD repeat protein
MSELADDFPTTGFVGSDDPDGNANIAYRVESNPGGIAFFENVTDTLPVWQAIQVYLPIQDIVEVEFSGTLPTVDNTYDVTFSDAGNNGINWVGNSNNSGLDIVQFSEQNGLTTGIKCWNIESLRWDLSIDGYSTNGMAGYAQPNQVCQFQFDADQSIPFGGQHELPSYEKELIAENDAHLAKATFGIQNATGFSDEAILVVKDGASFGTEFDEDMLNTFGQLDACDLYIQHGGSRYGISQVGFEGRAILEASILYSGNKPIDNLFTVDVRELELGDYCGFIQFEGEADVLPLEIGLMHDFQLTNASNFTDIPFATLYLVPPVRTEATSTACEGDEFAHIAVTPSGQGPWTYVMTNETGDSFEGVLSGNGVTTNFLDLPTGVYTGEVVTEDAMACGSLTFTEEVLSPTTIDMVTTVAHDCGEGGQVTIESDGGKLPVTYEWSNATSGDALTNAAAGIYEVIATDANGCKDTTSVEVLTAPTLTWTSQNTDCQSQGPTAIAFESANDTTTWSVSVKNELGDVVAAALNATAPFELTDLGAGTFSIDMDIMPSFGCATSTDVVTLLEPVAINMEATTHVQCNNLILGDAEVTVDGGVGEIALVWEDGTAGNTINNLVAGTYAVTATDELGCTETLDVVVELAPGMNIESISPGCEGEGATELTINGEGETTWNFTVYAATGDVYAEFNETDGHAELANLPSGTYYVVGVNTELNGCPQQDASVSLVQATDLEVEYSVVPLGCDGEHRGEIALDIETTATPVQVAWDHGATEATLTDLGPGQYYATVIDAYGCAEEVRVALEEAPSVVADFEVPTAGLTDGTNGMTLTFTNTSEGATDYTWYFGDTDVPSFDVHATHTFAEPGAYDVFLNAWNDHCSHTVRQTVIVSQGEDTTGDDDLGLLATGVAEGDWTEISAPIQTSNGWVMDLGVLAEGTKMMAYDLTGRALCALVAPDASGKIWVENDQWPAIVLLRLVHEPTNNIRTWKMLR